MKLLLIEDDLQLGTAEMRALEMAGFDVCWIRLLRDADPRLQSQHFDAVLLDLSLPDGDGIKQLIRWRRRGERVPVIILTARDAVEDRIGGLDSGADDYLPKPFAIPELISRLRALTRRVAGFASQIWQVDELTLDPVNYRVTLAQRPVSLPPKEFAVLQELMKNADQVVRKQTLMSSLFSDGGDGIESNSLEVHIHHLRRKLGNERILTVRGIGYLLQSFDKESA